MIHNRKLNRWYSASVSLLFGCLLSPLFFPAVLFADPIKAFPDAEGWAAYTPGGRGGKIIRVTNLKARGPGSFAAAVQMKGRRIIVFEVGGVIDLQKTSITIKEPFLTIAGQTAPSPGVTFIRGGIRIETHDVIVRHISVRPGEAGTKKRSGWEVDGIATGSYNIIVDHCSCTWATDENLSASGPRFDGQTVEQWRRNTSNRVTFSNCIIAEGLSNSTHGKGEHSKGSLIHDNATEIAIIGNLYANNMQRNPYFKGGVRGIVVNNYIVNPGRKAIHYGLPAGEWKGREYVTGQMAIIGNVMEHGRNTPPDMPLFVLSGSGPVDVFSQGNLALDRSGREVRIIGTSDKKCRRLDAPPLWPDVIEVMPIAGVKDHVLKNAGARPWDRNAIDKRIIREVREGTGRIIDSEQDVGGYPATKETRAAFDPNKWNLVTMEKEGDGLKVPSLTVLQSGTYRHYVELFNESDSNKDPDHAAFPKSQAWDFMIDYCPFFDCPDKEIEKTYYYRWWLFRKHIKNQLGQFVISEFIKLPPICCPAGHHVYEGRWLRNRCVLDDYTAYWFAKSKQGGDPRQYSFWAADACYARFLVTGDEKWIIDILPDLVKNYQAWIESNYVGDDLFFQYDGKDGMEKSAGGHGLRPSINSYMYGDAKAISKIANLAGNKTLADEYRIKAERIKAAVQKNLWDKKDEFFKTAHRKKDRLVLVPTREAIGFIPWYFNMPDSSYEVAWKQLMDPEGFLAPFGLTTAERRDPTFMTRKDNTPWDGQVWPFATTQTLVAMANLLNNSAQEIVSKEDYFQLLKLYAASHYSFFRNGTPMIGEWVHPVTGQWYIRPWSNERCSEHYNHSGFCDLIIAGLVGIRPQAGSDELLINPLLPENTWDYFCLDGIPYQGRVLTIIWDKTGKQYRKGTGLQVLCDGRRIGQRQQLGTIRLALPASIESSGE